MSMTNRQLLNEHGIKYSKQRDLLLDVLKSTGKPKAAEDLYTLCQETGSNISISTIYRILATFVDKELAVKTHLKMDNSAYYEFNRKQHKHHLLCLGCNELIEISGCPLKTYEQYLYETHGYAIVAHHLEVHGYCPNCQSNGEHQQGERA